MNDWLHREANQLLTWLSSVQELGNDFVFPDEIPEGRWELCVDLQCNGQLTDYFLNVGICLNGRTLIIDLFKMMDTTKYEKCHSYSVRSVDLIQRLHDINDYVKKWRPTPPPPPRKSYADVVKKSKLTC